MVRTFTEKNFRWIDIIDPSHHELNSIAADYKIHPNLVTDVFEPEHLPKYEQQGDTSFFILRYYFEDSDKSDTIQSLSNKIAVFQKDNLLITIHRIEIDFIHQIKAEFVDKNLCDNVLHLLNRIVKSVLQTYDEPGLALAGHIDEFEEQTFLKKNPPAILKKLYLAKRKIEVCRRLLLLSRDIVEKIDNPEHHDPETRDTRDLYVRIVTLYETMSENTNHLLTMYFSISAQKTNEVIRVLTLFSVFFMPLTFIVGIYGMNFDFMPELRWRFGYPLSIVLMMTVSFLIYKWFRRKGWL